MTGLNDPGVTFPKLPMVPGLPAGLPAGLGGDVESATSGNHNCDGPTGNDGSTAADGEQGGLGGGTFTEITKGNIVDSEYGTDNTYIPLGNVWSGWSPILRESKRSS